MSASRLRRSRTDPSDGAESSLDALFHSRKPTATRSRRQPPTENQGSPDELFGGMHMRVGRPRTSEEVETGLNTMFDAPKSARRERGRLK